MPLTCRRRHDPRLNLFPDLLSRLRDRDPDSPLPDGFLRDLAYAWGNPGFSAGKAYLTRIAERASVTCGPVLECGSGLSTLLIGMLTADRDVEVVALEHTAAWRHRVQRALDVLHLDHVRVLHCPVVGYGLYDWYQVSDPIPDNVRLVVCDGPPGRHTRGGRYGLMPVLGHHFHPDCIILLDDTHRQGERRVIRTWNRRQDFRIQHHGRWFRFAEMTAC